MNPIKIIAIGAATAAAVILSADTIKTERAKRKEIQLNTEKEIAALRTAAEIVKQEIKDGKVTSLEQAMLNVKFYTIVNQ